MKRSRSKVVRMSVGWLIIVSAFLGFAGFDTSTTNRLCPMALRTPAELPRAQPVNTWSFPVHDFIAHNQKRSSESSHSSLYTFQDKPSAESSREGKPFDPLRL